MNKYFRQTLLLIMLILPLNLWGMNKEFTISIKDASNIKTMFQKNIWFKEFFNSNLYRGLTLRANSALFGLGSDNDNKWEGRLIDYLYEKALQQRMLSFSYYNDKSIPSPFGLTLHDLGDVELSMIRTIAGLFKNDKFTPKKKVDSEVMAINIKNNRYALAFHGDCVSIGKSLEVVTDLSKECKKSDSIKSDGKISLALKNIFPSIFPFTHRFVGIGSDMKVNLTWDEKKNRFHILRGNLNLEEQNIVKQGTLTDSFLKAFPSDLFFMVVGNIPDPGEWNSENLKKYLAEEIKELNKRNSIPVGIVHLGMDTTTRKWKSLNALIIPVAKFTDSTMSNIEKVFGYTQFGEAKFKKVCKNYVAISNNIDSINKIEKSCLNIKIVLITST